jgi:hypothetical protein
MAGPRLAQSARSADAILRLPETFDSLLVDSRSRQILQAQRAELLGRNEMSLYGLPKTYWILWRDYDRQHPQRPFSLNYQHP